MLIDFPSFQNREEIYFLIVEATYSLAMNSINSKIEERLEATIDAYNQFKYNYNNSKYLNSLEETYKKTKEKLDNIKKIKNEI